MAELLYGAPAADEVRKRALELIEPLRLRPLLAIVRAGTDPDDLAYEKGIRAACAKCGVDVWTAELPAYVPEDTLVHAVHRIGRDEAVHGVIVMCPRQYDRGLIAAAIGRDKDVDGAGNEEGGHFTPCTAEAVMEILDHYGVECAGKKLPWWEGVPSQVRRLPRFYPTEGRRSPSVTAVPKIPMKYAGGQTF